MANTAAYVAADTATLGDWLGVFGADGYKFSGTLTDSDPAYLTGFTLSGQSTYSFGGSATNVAFVQDPADPPGTRYLPVWYGSSFVVGFGVGATTRRVALYLVDPLTQGRITRVVVRDGDDHTTVLVAATDFTPPASAYPAGVNDGGVWVAYDVTGNVEFVLSQGTGATELPCLTMLAFDTPGGGAFTLTAGVGSFALAGQAAGLRAARTLGAGAGSFALTGQAAGLVGARRLAAAAGAVAVSGQAAGVRRAAVLSAGVGPVTVAGQAAGLRAARRLACQPLNSVFYAYGQDVAFAPGVAPVTGVVLAVDNDHPHVGDVVRFTVTWSGGLAGGAAVALNGSTGHLDVNDGYVSASPFTYDYDTSQEAVGFDPDVTAAVDGYALPSGTNYVPAGNTVTLHMQPPAGGAFTLTAGTGGFALAGQTAGVRTARRLDVGPGAFAIGGADAGLRAARRVGCSAGGFDLAGGVTDLQWSGEPTPTPPAADFVGVPTSGTVPLAVAFTDLSTGSPTAWAWTFGDGGTSTQQHPTHTYAAPGLYSVTLTVTNAAGSDGVGRPHYVAAAAPAAVNRVVFTLAVRTRSVCPGSVATRAAFPGTIRRRRVFPG